MDPSLLFPLLILLLLVPILLNSRRQRRQVQQMQKLQQSLSPGDEVMTTSGLRATVLSVDAEDTVDLEIAPGVSTTWVRAAIREKVNPVVDAAEHVEVDDVEGREGTGGARAAGT